MDLENNDLLMLSLGPPLVSPVPLETQPLGLDGSADRPRAQREWILRVSDCGYAISNLFGEDQLEMERPFVVVKRVSWFPSPFRVDALRAPCVDQISTTVQWPLAKDYRAISTRTLLWRI